MTFQIKKIFRATFGDELLIKIIISDPINGNSAASLSYFLRSFCGPFYSLAYLCLASLHERTRKGKKAEHSLITSEEM